MLSVYLKKAPTLIVIGVTGWAAWPLFFPDSSAGTPKTEGKPPAPVKATALVEFASMRNPFQMDRVPVVAANEESKSEAELLQASARSADGLPESAVVDDDKVLEGMRLNGTMVDSREQLALIDQKVYARGDQLRGKDGAPLPYVVFMVEKDRAVIRRGVLSFVIGFADAPQPDLAKKEPPRAMIAAAATAAVSPTLVRPEPSPKPSAGPSPSSPDPQESDGPKGMIFQLLAGLGQLSNRGGKPGLADLRVNEHTIAAGLDVLIGQFGKISPNGDGGKTP